MTPATTPIPSAPVPALLSLALFEAMRGLDRPAPDDLDEYHGELSSKRLGLNQTVGAEIARLERMGGRARIPAAELLALLRLVARRQDAGLVFSEAGRRAARRIVRQLSLGARAPLALVPRPLRFRFGFSVAARLTRHSLGLTLTRDGRVVAAGTIAGSFAEAETGSPCTFYGSAVAELLRLLTDFDGAMVHVACRARGEAACQWRSARLHT